jgi:DNA polymerase III epsilon subunit family exonuclease
MNKIDLKIKLEDVVFTIFDTETTGDNTKNQDKPIEIAAVPWNLKKGFLDKPWSCIIDPEMTIHPSAIAVHGLTDEDVIGQKKLNEVLPEFHKYIDSTVLVAHNIDFDLNMLPSLKEQSNQKIDSLRFARHIYKIGDLGYKNQDLRSHKSQELRYWLNIKIDTMGLQAHRAAADILVTGEVFKETLKRFIEMTYSETLQDLIDFIKAPIIYEKMLFGKYKNLNLKESIEIELKNPKNYFAWLLNSVHKGEMIIDDDLKYSIEYNFKNLNIDPLAYYSSDKNKSWKEIASVNNKIKL